MWLFVRFFFFYFELYQYFPLCISSLFSVWQLIYMVENGDLIKIKRVARNLQWGMFRGSGAKHLAAGGKGV